MRKEKNRQAIYIAIFVGIIMILSVVGYFANEQSAYSYKKYSFMPKGNQWVLKINKKEVLFSYLPQEVENIKIDPVLKDIILNTKMVYITYSPKEDNVQEIAIAQYDLSKSLEVINVYAVNALTENDNGLQIDCTNATPYVPVILIKRGNENSISLNNNCIILEGNPIINVDRLKYAFLKIIE
ncbi:MAG: hypothetical protein QXG86_02335 [Candidatus Woesearchaeota archaeon]